MSILIRAVKSRGGLHRLELIQTDPTHFDIITYKKGQVVGLSCNIPGGENAGQALEQKIREHQVDGVRLFDE